MTEEDVGEQMEEGRRNIEQWLNQARWRDGLRRARQTNLPEQVKNTVGQVL